MKKFGIVLVAFLFTVPAMAEEQEHSQEYYDQQVAENMQELTSQVQQMSDTLVKYMTALNKVLGQSLPQMNENLIKAMSSMQPVAQTMQKNIEEFEKQLNAQTETLENEENDYPHPAGVKPQLASASQVEETDENINAAIDEELAQFEVAHPKEPHYKIKLFQSSVE